MTIPQSTASHGTSGRIRRLRVIAAIALISIAAVLPGCGGGSPSTGAGPSPATFTAAAFKYAACMRAHGLASFPDPVTTDHDGQQVGYLNTPSALAASPAFKSADRSCQRILAPTLDTSQSRASKLTREQHLLAFATCMRSHGASSFPDPAAGGQLNERMIASAGVDLKAPGVLAAAKACLPSASGTITALQLRRSEEGER
jgi:hypothetical protein